MTKVHYTQGCQSYTQQETDMSKMMCVYETLDGCLYFISAVADVFHSRESLYSTIAAVTT